MNMKLLDHSNLIGVVIDEEKRVLDSGIIISQGDAILEKEKQNVGVVTLVPQKTLYNVGKKEILIDPPVAVGDRVLLAPHAGIKTVTDDGQSITFVRVREILALVD